MILVGGLGDSTAHENESFAGSPLATHDVLGKPVVVHVVERLKAQGVNTISVTSESPMAGSARLPVEWSDAPAAQFWRVAENTFSDIAQAGAEAVLVIRMGGYSEFDVDDFLQRHLDGRAHVTRAVDVSGAPLDMFMINASRRNDAAYLFRHRLQQTRSLCGQWVLRGYNNPMATARDLRALAVDGLLQRAQLKPAGIERRPGVWVARGAQIDRRARVLAPAFIGAGARVRATAVVTRCGVVEHHAEVDSGTVVENATVLPYTYIGAGLDIAHAVAGGKKLLHLRRNVEVEIADPKLMGMRSQHAPLRALESAASLAAFLPVQIFRGLFATPRREQPAELPTAVKTPRRSRLRPKSRLPRKPLRSQILPWRGDMETNRPVVVKRIPERLNLRQARAFCREIEPILNSDRPQIVFDCSQVKQIDAAGVEMLLRCLAQVIKHDGDVKLAALSPEMAVILDMTRTERLFEIYDSSSDAVLSFSRFLPSALKQPATFIVPAVPNGTNSRPVSSEAASQPAEAATAADAAA